MNHEKNNQITITVITTDGNHKDDYNVHNTLQKVVDKTIKELELTINQTEYELVKKGSTNVLDLSLTIKAAGLIDDDILDYRIKNGGGGNLGEEERGVPPPSSLRNLSIIYILAG
ncbi:MAG TPA: hypothetical protein PK733_17995 [Clostridiales bacterium]|nr:hypothetical protein [Clostridiales bacterium]